jgi:hypothetical protein
MVKSKYFLLLFAFACASSVAQTTFDARELHFKSIFASRAGDKTIYSLLGNGFFVAPRAPNADAQITQWLAEHPDAKVTVVDTMSSSSKLGPLDYIWITSGDESLNIALVKSGAFAGGVMADPAEYMKAIQQSSNVNIPPATAPQRVVTDAEYAAFRERLMDAEQTARSEKAGIWSDSYKELRGEAGIQ